jgi:2,4-dienoyl-CoA reductase-like NADH-dependent reductase (Old Yellow Enzyme family)
MIDALFSSFCLGGLELPNRIVMSPMTRSFCPGGVPTADVAAYYRRRAAAGLIITEGTWIPHPGASNDGNAPRFYGEDALRGWRHVVEVVHDAGGRIMPQLWHVGLFDKGDEAGDPALFERQVGPSGYLGGMGLAPIKRTQEIGTSEIERLVIAYGDAAADAFRLGFDGVALHGAHGYLIDQFLWAETNRRSDAYGGDITRRSRFAADIVRECRRRTTPDFPILFRMSQWKLQNYEGHLAAAPAELEQMLAPLIDAGVDLFDCSQRRYWEPAFEGDRLNLAGWVKRLTDKPTMTVGSVGLDVELITSLSGEASQPARLDHLLAALDRGEFDLVGVGRAMLADPDWVQKIREGRHTELLQFDLATLATLH